MSFKCFDFSNEHIINKPEIKALSGNGQIQTLRQYCHIAMTTGRNDPNENMALEFFRILSDVISPVGPQVILDTEKRLRADVRSEPGP